MEIGWSRDANFRTKKISLYCTSHKFDGMIDVRKRLLDDIIIGASKMIRLHRGNI